MCTGSYPWLAKMPSLLNVLTWQRVDVSENISVASDSISVVLNQEGENLDTYTNNTCVPSVLLVNENSHVLNDIELGQNLFKKSVNDII